MPTKKKTNGKWSEHHEADELLERRNVALALGLHLALGLRLVLPHGLFVHLV
jgi:hypothetical protein